MIKKIVFFLLFLPLMGASQSLDIRGKTFQGIIESICGDGTGYTKFLYLNFENGIVKIAEEVSPIQGKDYITYKVQSRWTLMGSKIVLLDNVSDLYSFGDMVFRVEEGKLVGKKLDEVNLIEFEEIIYHKEVLDLFREENWKEQPIRRR